MVRAYVCMKISEYPPPPPPPGLSTLNFGDVLLLQSIKTIRCLYVRQPMCLLMHICYSKIHFHQLGPFELIKTTLNS